MGGMGNGVVDTVVRMLTRKALGKVMKTAKSASGKKKKSGPKKKGYARGKKGAREFAGGWDRGRGTRWIMHEARGKKRYAKMPQSVLRPTLGWTR